MTFRASTSDLSANVSKVRLVLISLQVQIDNRTLDRRGAFRMTSLTNSFSIRFSPKAPYDFLLTVRKPAGWRLFSNFEVFEEDVMWTAAHIEGVLVGIRLSSQGSVDHPQVSAKLHSEEKLTLKLQRAIGNTLKHCLGMDHDLNEFYFLARKDDILRHVLDDLYGMHPTGQSTIFPVASLAVLLQMAPIKRSNQMMECFMRRYGETAEYEDRRIPVWPLPGALAQHAPAELAMACKLGYRAVRLAELAKRIETRGFPTIRELEDMPPEESKRLLLGLPGIGTYSADIIDPHGGFPIDVWSADVFGKLFFGEEPKDKRREIGRIRQEGLRRWGKWSGMAFFYVVQDLENLSKRLNLKLRLA